MIRFLDWFSIERSTGLTMILMALLLLARPFAFGLEMLDALYGLKIPLNVFIWSMLFFGVALIFTHRVKSWMFLIAISPLWIYAISLFTIFLLQPTVGPFGFVYGFVASGCLIYMHTQRGQPD